MTRLLHTADTHIGYRQYHSPERRADFLSAFERVVDDAVEEGVDAVVHAGDVFHDRRPDVPDLLGTVAALRRLDDAGIPFLAVVGNHEDKREAQWLDLFEALDLAVRLDEAGVPVGDVTLYGLDYVPRSRRDDAALEFAPPETDHAALVAHGQFAPLAPSVHGDAWEVEEVIERASVDLDAVLLGDEHEPEVAEVADTWVTYSGSTERTSASERDDRGYNLVTFGPDAGRDDAGGDDPEASGRDVRIARRGLPTRSFQFVDVDLQAGEGVERVRERVRERDCEDAVVVVTIEGDGEPVTPAEVETYADERGALVARVNDRREVEADDEAVEVSFADPDEAVRERIRDLGLSGAAREVDETVRSSGLADSRVRDAVRDRVEDLLEDDPDAFESAPDLDGDDAASDEAGDGNGARASEAEDGDDVASDEAEATDAESDGSEAGEPTDDETGGPVDDETVEPADEGTGGPDATEPTDDDPVDDEAVDGPEDQASMEEYL